MGLSQPTVNKYLDDKYKVYTSEERKRRPKISAAERIRRKLGNEVVERHEREVERKLKRKSSKEILEKKRNKIVGQLPNEEDREMLREEIKQYDLSPEQIEGRVSEILDSKAGFEPALPEMFVEKGQLAVSRICKPLERFTTVDITAIDDLDDEQKGRVLAILLESQNRIAEWIKAIRDKSHK